MDATTADDHRQMTAEFITSKIGNTYTLFSLVAVAVGEMMGVTTTLAL